MKKITLNPKFLRNVNMRQAYIAGLALIFLLSCIKYFMVVSLVEMQDDEATIINLSGRQRMLSQRIALFSLEQMQQSQKSSDASAVLSATVDEFERNHNVLIYGDEALGIPPLKNLYIRDVYFQEPYNLDEKVTVYIAAARRILDRPDQSSLDYILNMGPNDLLNSLNTVVMRHEIAARENVSRTINLQRLFLALTFLVLVAEIIFIFAPLVRRIRENIAALQDRQELIESQHKELQHFTFIASHNLREPLRKITSFSQKLEDELVDQIDEKPKSYLNFIMLGAADMRDLVDGLRSYAQIMASSSHEMKKIPALNALNHAIERQRTLLNESGGDIVKKDLPQVFYNPMLLTLLFEVLINNAIKYKSERPLKITISCHEGPEYYTFSVKDNGIGIPQTHLERVFTMFQRLHRKEDISGTGVGLSIARKIVEGHGGKIWVESKEDVGSEFYFTVPNASM